MENFRGYEPLAVEAGLHELERALNQHPFVNYLDVISLTQFFLDQGIKVHKSSKDGSIFFRAPPGRSDGG